MTKHLAAPLSALLATLLVVDASAFCRSTTCDPRKSDCERDNEGCKITGKSLAWATSCPGLSVAPEGTQNIDAAAVERALTASLGAWSALACPDGAADFAWARLAPSSCAVGYRKSAPNANVIVFRDNAWPHQGAENTLGFTTVTFDVESGQILDSDTEINSAQNPITTADTGVKYDFQSILTHELGHALGIEHVDDPTAVMYYLMEGQLAELALAPTDVAAYRDQCGTK